MARIISWAASRYASLRPSSPALLPSRLKLSGGPKVTRTLPGRGSARPRGSAAPLPETYTGTTGAPLSTASIPTPGRPWRGGSPSTPRVPSGNTRIARPSCSSASEAFSARMSEPSRRTGRALSARISRPKSGMRNSSSLARKKTGRGTEPPTSGGSSTLT